MSSKEQQPASDPFGITEKERLWDRISDRRFQGILDDADTLIHEIELSTNNYGEFLFVTMSRAYQDKRQFVTFWGAGFHEYRERWLHDEWRWYEMNRFADVAAMSIAKEEAQQRIQARRDEIQPWVDTASQSGRGKFFEFLADLTDEDGAYSEMEDWGDQIDFDEF